MLNVPLDVSEDIKEAYAALEREAEEEAKAKFQEFINKG